MLDVLSAARDLTERDFFVIPLVHGSKASNIKGWPNSRISLSGIDDAFDLARDPGIGLLLGVSKFPDRCPVAIDVDIDDPVFIRRVRLAIPGPTPGKRGRKGITFFACTTAPFRAKHIMKKDATGMAVTAVDILSKGEQTVLPPSIHPVTEMPYEWTEGTLHDYTPETLPLITEHVFTEIELAAKSPDSAFFAINDMVGGTRDTPGDAHNSVLSAVAVMVSLGWTNDAIWSRVARATEYTHYDPPANWEGTIRQMADDARSKGFDKPLKKEPHVAAAEWMMNQWRGPGSIFNLDGAVAAYVDGHYEVLTPYHVRHAVATQCPIRLDGHSHWDTVYKTILDNAPLLILSDRNRVCLRNGTFDLDTGELRPWSRDDHLLTALPFSYIPDAECPVYDRFMRETFAGDDVDQSISTFEEFVAHTLVPCLKYQKFLVMRGPPATGKSMLLHVIGMLHDDVTVTAVSTSKFGDEKYAAHMIGKLVNLTSEVASFSYMADDFLKSITAGDPVVVRHLYQPPARYILPTRIVVACNELFRVRDTTGSIERRMIALPCEHTVPYERQDANLKDKLRGDLPGIFMRMASAWLRLSGRGRFDPPAAFQREIENFSLENNHCKQWYQERTHQGLASVDPNYELPSRLPPTENPILFSDYAEWSKFNGFQPISSITFGTRLSNINSDLRPRVVKVGGTSVRVRPITLVSGGSF